jgi:hypothetical protein
MGRGKRKYIVLDNENLQTDQNTKREKAKNNTGKKKEKKR